MMGSRISLVHRVDSRQWKWLVYIQGFCMGIRKTTAMHWNKFPGWKEVYDRHMEMLEHLTKSDKMELKGYIQDNDLEWSAYKVRRLVELEMMPNEPKD
jgi:hypothetical protein